MLVDENHFQNIDVIDIFVKNIEKLKLFIIFEILLLIKIIKEKMKIIMNLKKYVKDV
jgi:hypothetical protein